MRQGKRKREEKRKQGNKYEGISKKSYDEEKRRNGLEFKKKRKNESAEDKTKRETDREKNLRKGRGKIMEMRKAKEKFYHRKKMNRQTR